jgi:hypothetical protein
VNLRSFLVKGSYFEPIGYSGNSKDEVVRTELPYGKWTTADGSEYLFNRNYENIIGKDNQGNLKAVHPYYWHDNIVKHEYYYNDLTTPWRKKATLLKVAEIKHNFIRGQEPN